MKIRYLISLVTLFPVLFSPADAQPLSEQWKRIQVFFIAARHDSVIKYIPGFIKNLEVGKLADKIPIANYHFGVSLMYTGSFDQADSVFNLACYQCIELNDLNRLKDIRQKQISLYRQIASEKVKSNPLLTLKLLTRILTETNPDSSSFAGVLEERAGLFLSSGQLQDAETDLETALNNLPKNERTPVRLQSINLKLLSVKFNTGRVSSDDLAKVTPDPRILEPAVRFANSEILLGHFQTAEKLLNWFGPVLFETADFNPQIPAWLIQRYQISQKVNVQAAAEDSLISGTQRVFRLNVNAEIKKECLIQTFSELMQGRQPEKCSSLIQSAQNSGFTPAVISKLRGDFGLNFNQYTLAYQEYKKVLAQPALPDSEILDVLNNLSVVCINTGNYQEAFSFLGKLNTAAVKAGNHRYIFNSQINQALCLINTDQPSKAIQFLYSALATAKASGSVEMRAITLIRIAETLELNAQESASGSWLKMAESLVDSIADLSVKADVLLSLAGKDEQRGNLSQAENKFRSVYAILKTTDDPLRMNSLANEISDLKIRQDSVDAAIFWIRLALKKVSGLGLPQVEAENRFKLANLFLETAAPDSVRRYTLSGLSLLTKGSEEDLLQVQLNSVSDPYLFCLGLSLLAVNDFTLARSKQDLPGIQKAEVFAQRSVSLIEKLTGSSEQDEVLAQRMVGNYRLMVDIYFELFRLTGDQIYLDLAWVTSEKARSRQYILDAGKHLLSKINDPELKKLRNTQAALSSTESLASPAISGLPEKGQRGIKVKKAEKKPTGNLDEYRENEEIMKSLMEKGNKASQLVQVNIMNRATALSYLKPKECILNYFISSEKLYLFIIDDQQSKIVNLSVSPDSLREKVGRFRIAIGDTVSENYRDLSLELYRLLISPVSRLSSYSRLIIIPSGPMHFLPFTALNDGSHFLGETIPVTLLPNVSTLQFFHPRDPNFLQVRALCLGNPENPEVSALPGSEIEVRSLKEIYKSAIVLTGNKASEFNLKENAGGFNILHIASHGIFNPDFPYMSHLALSPDPHDDGNLLVHELYNLNLIKTDLVVLSACETGLAQIKKNDDMVGLVRGFIYSGVSSVVASLWKVDDFATMKLMKSFHSTYYKGNSASRSLQEGIKEMLANEHTRHPYYWAAFSVYGRGN